MSINVKKGQRVICELSWNNFKGTECFTKGKKYYAIEDNSILDNFMAIHNFDSRWFNDHFTLIPFTPVIQKKKYYLSYEFLGVKHSTPYDTIFEFAQALDKIMDLAEVPQSTIDFKTETI